MRLAPIRRLLIALVIVTLPMAAYAQEATFAGTVTDSTGAVLPGVTITAVHTASGNTFTTVTDERGEFRLPVRVGNYTITSELSGFTIVSRSLQILIGQTTPVDVQMAPSTVQETVTVTGDAPLVDTTGSTVGTNIDPRQMQELPINGRNWMDLTLLAPGARRNEGGGMVQFRQGTHRPTSTASSSRSTTTRRPTPSRWGSAAMPSRSSRSWPTGSMRRWVAPPA